MSRKLDLDVLIAVVDHGSFSAAARVLGQTPSAIGKRVQQLEDRLGTALLIRSTRSMTLTEAGRKYTDEGREILAGLTALEDDIAEGSGALRGTVRLTSPHALGRLHVVPMVTRFMRAHPAVEVDLTMTDRLVDLVSEGMDLAIRSGVPAESSLIGRSLMPYRRMICAAPDYLARHGRPAVPDDLQHHRCLKLGHERMIEHWGLTPQTGGARRLGQGFRCNSLEALHAACLAGEGLACLPVFVAQDDIAAGRIGEVLAAQGDPQESGNILLLRPESGFVPRRVRRLMDVLIEGFAQRVQARGGGYDP